MALIICSECNKKISDKSEKCIGCGAPIEVSILIKKNINTDKHIDENTIKDEKIPEFSTLDKVRWVLGLIGYLYAFIYYVINMSDAQGFIDSLSLFVAYSLVGLFYIRVVMPYKKAEERKRIWKKQGKLKDITIATTKKKVYTILVQILTILIKFTLKYKLINDNIVALKNYIDVKEKNNK